MRPQTLPRDARAFLRAPASRSKPVATLPNRSMAHAAPAAPAAPAVARFPTAVAEIAGASVDVAVIGKSRIAVAPIGVVGVPRAQTGTSRRVAPRLRMDRRADMPTAMVLARLAHGKHY